MKRFTVSCDILLPVVLEIEAESADGAVDKLYDMEVRELLKLANTSDPALLAESVDVDEVPEEKHMTMLRCDMENGCLSPVTHIDERGFIYCAKHGAQRKIGGTRCRKLRPTEIRRLRTGQTIVRYAP